MRGKPVHIPGLMLWIAVIYSFVAMGLTHLVRALLGPPTDSQQQRSGGGLPRPAGALPRQRGSGGAGARRRLRAARRSRGFRYVIENWWQLISAQRNLTLFTTTIGQINGVVPLLIAAPAYFAGDARQRHRDARRLRAGPGALAWFVYAYQEIAQWRERRALHVRRRRRRRGSRSVATHGIQMQAVKGDTLHLRAPSLSLPDGRVLARARQRDPFGGDRVAVLGATAAGKTTLFRAIAGLGRSAAAHRDAGRVDSAPICRSGRCARWCRNPGPAEAFAEEKVCDVLRLLELGRLEVHLHDAGPWDQQLTDDEQQRLTVVVPLHEPDWIFMDDVIGGVDEAMERAGLRGFWPGTRPPRRPVMSMTPPRGAGRDSTRAGSGGW